MTNYCPIVQDMCVSRGDSPIIRVEVRDDAGSILDITGHSFVMTVDPSPAPENADNNLFSVSVPAIGDGSTGIVAIQPSSANTNQTPGVYFYDIQMTTTAPSIRTILAGKFTIQQDVTKV